MPDLVTEFTELQELQGRGGLQVVRCWVRIKLFNLEVKVNIEIVCRLAVLKETVYVTLYNFELDCLKMHNLLQWH